MTKKMSFAKTIIASLLVTAVIFMSGFSFSANIAEAKKKKSKSKVTKWQQMLERNGVDQALWQKYLPKVSRKEYNRVRKLLKKMGTPTPASSLGPDITVGLVEYTKSNLKDSPFRIHANKNYNVRNKDGNIITSIPAATETKVRFDSGHNLIAYESVGDTVLPEEVIFDATDGDNGNLIFDINKPGSNFDQYRGKMKLRYYDADGADEDRIWAINTLPMEHYVWGMGETTGTGPADHTKVMTVAFRTYGYWKIKYGTKYAGQGFKVDATSGSQIYYGYDWEAGHPKIKEAAETTRGKIVTHKGEIAITPYSSYTDGHTRSWEEHWGSDEYPWCQSVKDPYGKHPSLSTDELFARGNHMVGLSAHGSLKLADEDEEYKWSWEKILKYYFTGIDISGIY